MNNQQEEAFWISYSDLAVGVLMIFVLITTALLMDTEKKIKQADDAQQAAQEANKEAEQARQEAERFREELKSQRAQIEALMGVRQSLIAELSKEFAKEGQQVQIDPKTGALVLPSDIIFGQNESQLSVKGRKWLKSFVPKYLGVLLSEKFAPYVSRIEVEGHASSEGEEFSNLRLSQNRALEVTQYILRNHASGRRKKLRQVLVASGRGVYEPVLQGDGIEDKVASRRVVFKFRLTEEKTIKEIQRTAK